LVIFPGLYLPQEPIRDKPLPFITNPEPEDPVGVADLAAEARLAVAAVAAEAAK